MAYVKENAPSKVYHLTKKEKLNSILEEGRIRRFGDTLFESTAEKEITMRDGNLLIDMHVHLAQYKVLSDSTREWFISLYPSEADYQAVCDANASPDDFCAMLAEKGVDYAVVLAEDTPVVTGKRTTGWWRTSARGIPSCCPSAPSIR